MSTDPASTPSPPEPDSRRDDIGHAIGVTVRKLRESRTLTARELAHRAGVSAAMISRIESGQVSPSIATLAAIGAALDVPLVSLFRDTGAGHADFTHVRQGKGLVSTRTRNGHVHEFVNLALHARRDIGFEARTVTLTRQQARPPMYIGHGVVFVYALEGQAVYRYGEHEITLAAGDSLSLDAEQNHGFAQVITPRFVFLTVQAEARG